MTEPHPIQVNWRPRHSGAMRIIPGNKLLLLHGRDDCAFGHSDGPPESEHEKSPLFAEARDCSQNVELETSSGNVSTEGHLMRMFRQSE